MRILVAQVARRAGRRWRERTGARSDSQGKNDAHVQFSGLYPNALAVMTDAPVGCDRPAESHRIEREAYNLPIDKEPSEAAWLVDWKGKLLKTVTTNSRNTSGLAYGDGCVWMGATPSPTASSRST